MAQPGLYSTAAAISTKAKVKGKNKKRKKSTMAGGACATLCSSQTITGTLYGNPFLLVVVSPMDAFLLRQ